jgi:hypothetical protein
MEEIMENEETKDDKETEDIKPLGTWYYNGNFYHDGYAVESIWGNFLHILSCEKIETKKGGIIRMCGGPGALATHYFPCSA